MLRWLGGAKQKKPHSYLQNDLESSSFDLTVYINKSCCMKEELKGNAALPECRQCLQGLQQ